MRQPEGIDAIGVGMNRMKYVRLTEMLSRIREKLHPWTLSDVFFFLCLLGAFVLASLFL